LTIIQHVELHAAAGTLSGIIVARTDRHVTARKLALVPFL